MKKIKKCSCGSTDFWLEETLGWKCSINEEGYLDCFNKYNEIDFIKCQECGKKYNEENFKELNFM